MMREIKFRAWDKTNKHMWSADNDLFFTHIDDHEADEENIIMQYTGLKDKNGMEIYESDIIEINDQEYEAVNPVSIVFKNGSFVDSYYHWSIGKHTGHNNVVKLIGNIYENPELLKGESCQTKN